MIDFIMALAGKRHCGWCNYKDTDPVARWLGADKYISQHIAWWQRVGWFIYNNVSYKLGIWKLGQCWHWRRHVDG